MRDSRYGPVRSVPATLVSGVRSRHGPYRITRSCAVTVTPDVHGVTPNGNPRARPAGSKANANRRTVPGGSRVGGGLS
jgi:hypothetical protein